MRVFRTGSFTPTSLAEPVCYVVLLPAFGAEFAERRMGDRVFFVVVRLVHVHAFTCRGVEHFGLVDMFRLTADHTVTETWDFHVLSISF
jgi:hypothetical protein